MIDRPRHPAFALLVLLAYAAVPVLEVWAANADEGLALERVVAPLLVAWAIALALLLVLKLVMHRRPLARLALALGPPLLLFAAYGAPREALAELAGHDAALALGLGAALWLALLLVLGAWLLRRVEAPAWRGGVMVLGVVALAWPVAHGLLTHRPAAAPVAPDAAHDAGVAPAARPNVYWLIADSYPRVDALAGELGHDAAPLQDALERLGFATHRGLYANYPFTRHSVAATLDARLSLTDASSLAELREEGGTLEAIRSGGRVRHALAGAGYAFVRIDSGYDTMTACSGREQLCIPSAAVLDELALALLGRTPLEDLGFWRLTQRWLGTAPSFEWRGFDAVQESLPRLAAAPAPRFVLAHVMAPHPPIRYTAECGFKGFHQRLANWNARSRGDFVDQLRCVDRQLLDLLPALLAADPDAIVVLTSDHGSAFRGQYQRGYGEWTREDVVERFGVLAAARLPERCRAGFAALRTTVNLFPEVLGCALGLPLPRQPDLLYILPNDRREGRIVRREPPPAGGPWTAVAGPLGAR